MEQKLPNAEGCY